MSPRKPAVLRGDDGGQNLREHLIATAARLIDEQGGAGLAVRDIAREAQVAGGVLYNYFDDKEDLLAQALLAHVAAVMTAAPPMPPAGTGTVADNLRLFVDNGLRVLVRLMPAFAGLLAQPKVLTRFHGLVGGDDAFGAATEASDPPDGPSSGSPGRGAPASGGGQSGGGQSGGGQSGTGPGGHQTAGDPARGDGGPQVLPEALIAYLRAEQRLGRVDPDADVHAATALIVGAIHGQILPRILFNPPGQAVTAPPGFATHITATILGGIAPKPRPR